MKRGGWLLMSILILAVAGCGGDGLTATRGMVTLDGRPLERGQIDFEPAEGPGPRASAKIHDGQFEVRVTPGKMKVRITGGKVVGQHPFSEDPGSPPVEDIQLLVPERYNVKSTLSREITTSQSVYDFELTSTP